MCHARPLGRAWHFFFGGPARPAAIAWSLAQLNTLPAVFLGILVFHEIHWTTHRRAIILGLLAATVGTVLLGAAK